MTTYGYCRVSTTRQGEGDSLDLQRQQIIGHAMVHSLDVDEFFVEDGVSGSIPVAARPEGSKLFAKLKRGDVIISAKLDRLFRSALDALQVVADLKARGVKLHLIDLGGDVSGNGVSRMFMTMVAAFAEFERDRIRERVTASKADQKSRGRYLGGVIPFGFTIGDDGQLVPDPVQQKAIRKMHALRAKGSSLRDIQEAMAARGHKLSHMGVKVILERDAQKPKPAVVEI
jgi:DNA invertase Pin-like site-specific DNA recombinase